MKNLLKLFPAFALLIGVSFAFASVPTNSGNFAQTKKANQNGTWVDITGKILGTHYLCPSAQTVCTQLFDPSGNPIPGTEEFGTYTPIQ